MYGRPWIKECFNIGIWKSKSRTTHPSVRETRNEFHLFLPVLKDPYLPSLPFSRHFPFFALLVKPFLFRHLLTCDTTTFPAFFRYTFRRSAILAAITRSCGHECRRAYYVSELFATKSSDYRSVSSIYVPLARFVFPLERNSRSEDIWINHTHRRLGLGQLVHSAFECHQCRLVFLMIVVGPLRSSIE